MHSIIFLFLFFFSFSICAQDIMPDLAKNLEYANKGKTQKEVLDRIHQNYTNEELLNELEKYQAEMKRKIQEEAINNPTHSTVDNNPLQKKSTDELQINNSEAKELLEDGIVRSYDEDGHLNSEMFLNEGYIKVYNKDGSYKVMNYGNASKGEDDGAIYMYDSQKRTDPKAAW